MRTIELQRAADFSSGLVEKCLECLRMEVLVCIIIIIIILMLDETRR